MTTHSSGFRKKTAMIAACALLALTGGQAQAREYSHHGGHHHGHGHRDNGPRCRTVVQKFRIGPVTYSETGLSCFSGGAWRVVSETRYPYHSSSVYFVERGGLVFAGYSAPRIQKPYYEDTYEESYDDNNGEDMHRPHGYDREERDLEHCDRNNGYNDEKNYKKVRNDHFFD